MADDTLATSKPTVDAAESKPAENVAAAGINAASGDSTAPEAAAETDTSKVNGAEEKQAADATVTEPGKTEQAEAPGADAGAPAETADAKEQDATTAAAEAAPEGDAAAAATAEPNGTPASLKRTSSSKRKSTGGVPEHKNKLNRKKSQVRVTHLHAKPGEYYIARLRSYPPWPSIICDEEMLPQSLLSTRPVTAMRPDGTYRDDYADGGKRAHERTFPIMFLQTNEFAWIPNTDLTPLDPETCKDVPEKGKSKPLIAAYAIAAENHDLQYFKDMLADHQRAIEQELEEREAEAAAKAAAKAERDAKKKKRKSMDVGEEPDDFEMEDVDDEEKKTKASKKRKKDADTDADTDKPAKTPKTAQKLKLTTPKAPGAADSGKKTPGTGKAKQAGGKKGGKAAASDESDAADAEPKEKPKPLTPEEARNKRQKEVLYIRHKLQRAFLGTTAPKEADMPTLAGYFTKLESYEDLEVSIIRSTRINKVLKFILKLDSIPREEEFNFRSRALALLNEWKTVLASDTTPGAADKHDDDELKANGVHKDDEEKADTPSKLEDAPEESEKPVEKEEQEPAEPADEPMPDAAAEVSEKTQAPEPVAKEGSEAAVPAAAAKEETATEEKAPEVAAA